MTPLFEILDVALAEAAGLDMWGSFIDSPQPGRTHDADAVELVGWALGRQSRAVAVEITRNGKIIGSSSMDELRTDVAAAFPHVPSDGRDGFRATVSVMDGHPDVELQLRAVLADGHRAPLGAIRGRRRWSRGPRRSLGVVSAVICPGAAGWSDALDSVRDQTHPWIEAVVAVSGTSEARALAERHPDVRPVAVGDPGSAEARNAGIRNSTGEYLVFLGPGERLLRDAVEIGIRHLERDADRALAAGRSFLAGDGASPPSEADLPAPPRDFADALLAFPAFPPPAATIHRRSVLEYVGGFDAAFAPYDCAALMLRATRDFRICAHDDIVAAHSAGADADVESGARRRAAMTALRTHARYVEKNPRYRAVYQQAIDSLRAPARGTPRWMTAVRSRL